MLILTDNVKRIYDNLLCVLCVLPRHALAIQWNYIIRAVNMCHTKVCVPTCILKTDLVVGDGDGDGGQQVLYEHGDGGVDDASVPGEVLLAGLKLVQPPRD